MKSAKLHLIGDSLLVLSLFPGIDMLGLAFKREGFHVVQGGDVIYMGDVREEHYPPGKFEGVIGGPPCQAFSRLAHMVRQNGLQPKFGNLIPEFERVVSETEAAWFLMENVPDAPVPRVPGYDVYSYILNNRQCFGEDGKPADQNRIRRFSWGWRGNNRPTLCIDICAFESARFEYAVTGGSAREVPIAIGGNGKVKRSRSRMPFNSKSRSAVAELCRKQGLPADSLKHVPFTVEGLCKALGNGVPLPMGRAIARAVKEAVSTSSNDRET